MVNKMSSQFQPCHSSSPLRGSSESHITEQLVAPEILRCAQNDIQEIGENYG